MGVVGRWGGIRVVIRSREDDRHEPHFHVMSAERSASISIAAGQVYASTLTSQELREVQQWAAANRVALKAAWDDIQAGRSPGQIAWGG